MLLKLFAFRFSNISRNFFPVGPLFPEKESMLYRPYIDKTSKLVKSQSRLYTAKLDKIGQRIKTKIQNDLNRGQGKEERRRRRQEQLEQILRNVIIDEDSSQPLGLMFDDFVMEQKAKSTKQSERDYYANLKSLLGTLRLKNESELVNMSKVLLSKQNADNYLGEARHKIFVKLHEQVQQLKYDEEGCKLLFGEYFDEKHSTEFLKSQVQDGSEEAVTGLLKEKVVNQTAQQLAYDKITEDVQQFKKWDAHFNPTTTKAEVPLGFYESPYTPSDVSDDERLIGMRVARKFTGQEAFQTQQSIQDKTNLDFIKRSYLRLKNKEQDEIVHEEEIIDKDVDPLTQYFDSLTQTSDIKLHQQIKSVNKSALQDVTYDSIVKQIDYLLLNAPKSLKAAYQDPNGETKRYQPTFLGNEGKQSLLWNDFEDTFPTVFPHNDLKGLPQTKKEQEEQQQAIYMNNLSELFLNERDEDRLKDRFTIELYKELQQPGNVQFFSHYLSNQFRINRDSINDGIQSFSQGVIPHMISLPEYNLLEDEDQDVMPEEIEEFEDNSDKSIAPMHIHVLNEYKEAALLTYGAQGKRKSSKAVVVIKKGYGNVTINHKNVIHYFPHPYDRRTALRPIELAKLSCYIDVEILVRGGSVSAQSQAICVGLSRAMIQMCPSLKSFLRKLGLTRTDARKVERKKIGLYKARKRFPYSRR